MERKWMENREELNRSSSKFVKTRRGEKEEEENVELETLRKQQTCI